MIHIFTWLTTRCRKMLRAMASLKMEISFLSKICRDTSTKTIPRQRLMCRAISLRTWNTSSIKRSKVCALKSPAARTWTWRREWLGALKYSDSISCLIKTSQFGSSSATQILALKNLLVSWSICSPVCLTMPSNLPSTNSSLKSHSLQKWVLLLIVSCRESECEMQVRRRVLQ